MKDTNLPQADNFVRYVKPSMIRANGTPEGGSFCLRAHRPTDDFPADPSHAEVLGLPPGDSDQAQLVGDLISRCVTDMHPAIEPHNGKAHPPNTP